MQTAKEKARHDDGPLRGELPGDFSGDQYIPWSLM
jgi:hypothetical protein